MKKAVFFLFLIFVLKYFFLPRGAYAACSPPTRTGMCLRGYFMCIDPIGQKCCCEVKDECKASSCAALKPIPKTGGVTQPNECDTPAGPKTGIETALGCIPTKDTAQFVGWLLKVAIGIGGGVAFLLMIFGGFKIITSSGNPEATKAGQEMITSALTGLLFIIFSLFLLELIGVKILQIPGFSTP